MTVARLFPIALTACLAVALIALSLMAAAKTDRWSDNPDGCDAFGYLRQAELFDEKGIPGGFDTRFTGATVRALVDAAKALGEPVSRWSQAVAPHCHHYKASTDSVVLQYPPGHGFLLSLFPDGERVLTMHRTIIAAIGALTLALLIFALHPATAVLVTGLGALVIVEVTWGPAQWSSEPSLLAAMVLAWLGVRWLEMRTFATRLGLAIVIGLCLGIATNVRVPNVLLFAGYGAALGLEYWRGRDPRTIVIMAAGLAAFAAGLVPTLISNFLNAGSILSTTYSSIDASVPSVASKVLERNLAYYFSQGWHSVMAYLAVAMAAALMVLRNRLPPSMSIAVPAAVATNLGVSLVYFLTHDVTTPYYLLPATVWCVSAGVFAFASRPGAGFDLAPVRILTGAVAAAALFAVMVAGFPYPARDGEADRWNVELSDDTVVWADYATGMVILNHGHYSAKPMFARPDVRDALYAELLAQGVPQVFVSDSGTMEEIISELDVRGRVERVGDAFGVDVYRLKK